MNKRKTVSGQTARERAARVVRSLSRQDEASVVEDLFEPEIDPAALAPLRGGAPADGLLLASIKNDVLNIRIPIKTDPTETVPDWDGFQLFIDDSLYDNRQDVVDADLTAGFVNLVIAAADRREKIMQTPYRVRYRKWKGPSFLNQYTDWPTAIQFIVDLTPPGPHLSNPFIDPDIVKSGLTSAMLTDLGDKLPAEIYSYGFQALGDNVYLMVNDIVSTAPITRDDVTNDFVVEYPRALIELADDGPVDFKYRVEDRAGNMSTDSDPTTIRVLLKIAIDDLEQPEVPVFAQNDIIVDADARAGVLVQIPFHDRIEAGDEIVVVWGGRDQEAREVLAADLLDPDFVFGPDGGIAVQYEEVLAALDGATRGTVSVAYKVLRDGFTIGTSPDLDDVLIDLTLAGGEDPDPTDPVHGLLLPLTIRPPSGAGPDNIIPPDQFGDDATAVIPWENKDGDPVFEEGDEIQVYWDGAAALAAPYTIEAADVVAGAVPPQTVLGTVIEAGGSNPRLPVHYTVTRTLQPPPADQSNTSLAPDQLVDVQSSDDLPGGAPGLSAGDFPEAQGTPGNRVVTIAVAQGGTLFQVAHYLNQVAGDTVFLEAQAYTGLSGGAPVGDKLEQPIIVKDGEENDPVNFLMPQTFFLIDPLDASIGRVVVTYTVTQDRPNPIPVTSPATTAVTDVRGWKP